MYASIYNLLTLVWETTDFVLLISCHFIMLVIQVRVCGNPHSNIRKYGLMSCRKCLCKCNNAKEICFTKTILHQYINNREFLPYLCFE
ncbi:hypothetical protein MKX03_002641 [Papaver bracteatum]|nr:hypothetical protein MKX03_002641 [Papaver bracteatum]